MLPRHIDGFMQSSLAELLSKYGARESRHMILLHVYCTERGVVWCRVLTKVQVPTPNDFL